MLTSVIMPSHDSGTFIAGAIESVRAQTHEQWELLVSDDGSTDDTLEIVRGLAEKDSRIKLLASEGNQGSAAARNLAIDAARGRYIAFLDSDDLWKPDKLERQLAFMAERDIAFSFSSYDRIDEAGNFINTRRVEDPVTYHDLLKSCVIGCLTAVYDTEKVGKMFMPDIRKRQDFGLWLAILKKTDRAWPLSDSLALYRVRSNSISSNKLIASTYTWTVYRKLERLGLLRSAYYFSQYAWRGVFNTYILPHLPSGTKSR